MRPEIAKGGGFEGAEELRIQARMSFYWSFGRNYQKIWAKGGGVLTPHIPLLATPLTRVTHPSKDIRIDIVKL